MEISDSGIGQPISKFDDNSEFFDFILLLLNLLLMLYFSDDLLVFLKYYDPKHKMISYIGHLIVPLHSTLRKCLPEMCKRANLDPRTELLIFEVCY